MGKVISLDQHRRKRRPKTYEELTDEERERLTLPELLDEFWRVMEASRPVYENEE